MNARTVDAEDVAFSYQRMAAIGTNRRLFVNAESPKAPIESVTAADSSTVILKLAFPSPALLSTMATFTAGSFYIMPRESDGGIDLERTQLGSGPFMLTEYSSSQRYVYKRNEGLL